MQAIALIAISIAVLIAIPAGMLLWNSNYLQISPELVKKPVDEGNMITQPEPQRKVMPDRLEQAPPEAVGEQQAVAGQNIAKSQNATLSIATLSVRRILGTAGQENIRGEITPSILASNPKLKEAIEKYEAEFAIWEKRCNMNEARRVQCNEEGWRAPGSVLLRITNDEFNALKAVLNPGPPLESEGRHKGEIQRLYSTEYIYNGIRYMISLHTGWTLP